MKKTFCFFLALLMLFGLFFGCKTEQGSKEKDKEDYAIYTENFGVTEGMLQYQFSTKYLAFVNANSENLSSIGIDVSSPLSEQEYSQTTSWYDYFLDLAKEDLQNYLLVEELAKKEKIKLNKSEKKLVAADFSIIEEYAENENMKVEEYIKQIYGKSVSPDDVKKVLEMVRLSGKCFEKYSNSLKINDETLEKYFSDRKKSFSRVDYVYFETLYTPQDASQKLRAGNAANRFAEKTSVKAFKKYISEYINDYYIDKDGSNFSPEKIKEAQKTALENCEVKNATYNARDAASVWAFDEKRQVGDTKIIEDDTNGKYYIYYLTKPMYKEEYNVANIRQLFFSFENYSKKTDAKAEAEACIEKLKKENFSEAVFEKEAKEKSSDDATKNYGGKQENLYFDSFNGESAKIRDWIFSDKRKEGEYSLFETEDGFVLIYFDSFGEAAWKSRTRDSYKNSEFSRYVSDIGDDHVIKFNSELIDNIEQVEIE